MSIPRGRRTPRRSLIAAVLITVVAAVPAIADVNPPSVEATLAPGESVVVQKTVDVPAAPAKADVYILADTTGSMGAAVTDLKSGLSATFSQLRNSIADVQFGAGDYRDFVGASFAFRNGASLGADDGAGGAPDASSTIAFWFPTGGGDRPEAQFYAFEKVVGPTIGWRADAAHVLVWIGDAPGHDPICPAVSGLADNITEATATQKLVDAGVRVVAMTVTNPLTNGLNGDPTFGSTDYGVCGTPGGASGQATRITNATGGVLLPAVLPTNVAEAIVAGVGSLTFEVEAVPSGCDPLQVSFDPPVRTGVVGGTQASFTETIAVPSGVSADDLPADGVVHCSVDFLANGMVVGTQSITVTVSTEPATLWIATVVDSEPDGVFDDDPTGMSYEVTDPSGVVAAGTSGWNPLEFNLDPSTVTVTQTAGPPGTWSTSVACVDVATGALVGAAAGPSVSGLVLAGGQGVTCTFSNQLALGELTGGGQLVAGKGNASLRVSLAGNLSVDADGVAQGQWQTSFHDVSADWLDQSEFHGSVFGQVSYTDLGGGFPFEMVTFAVTGALNGVDGWSLQVQVADQGDLDTVAISLHAPDGTLAYSTATDFSGGVLTAGNLKAHS